MALTRRGFVRRMGQVTATVSGAALSARGFEAMTAAHAAGQDRPQIPPGMIRLGSNESPYGPGPRVVAAVERALLDDGNRYSRSPSLLTGRVAAMQGISAASVLVAAGSGDLLRASVFAWVTAERPLVAATPTFETPVRTAGALRMPVRMVPLTPALTIDLDRMAEQGHGAGLVYVCNPDNPTGTFHPKTAIVSFIERIAAASPETVVMIDEAYFDCADDPTYGSVASLAAERRNLVVLRTFSKIHGLAGMRIGYAIGQPDTLERLRLCAGSGTLACASVAAAIASLDDTVYFARQQALNREARARLVKAFTEIGYPPVPSQANFVMVDVRRDVRDFGAACRERGVLIGRPFPPLATQARISFGTPDEMTTAIAAFRAILVS